MSLCFPGLSIGFVNLKLRFTDGPYVDYALAASRVGSWTQRYIILITIKRLKWHSCVISYKCLSQLLRDFPTTTVQGMVKSCTCEVGGILSPTCLLKEGNRCCWAVQTHQNGQFLLQGWQQISNCFDFYRQHTHDTQSGI